ncbi:uncharacterized protein si:ch211-244b2.4 [Osmerus eperlanus]|uniref:uncharacterized protein si:ch211-244b2.4 n=1 Tax=Osmerus eperlanus TaxID=29151 RepID=UPI002E156A28
MASSGLYASSVKEEYSSSSDDEVSSMSDPEVEADRSLVPAHQQTEPCRYYNSRGGCRRGAECLFLHLCKYAVGGMCRKGTRCSLAHPGAPIHPSGDHRGDRSARGQRSQSREGRLSDERAYQWQLNVGQGWVDVANDHIIEAQYSLPNTSVICIFNTPYGRVNIDFKRMRVLEKDIRVRRLDGRKTTWVWFYSSSGRGWVSYDRKDSTGKPGPVKSSEIEQQYQQNPKGSLTFHINSDQYEIKFKEKQQVGRRSRRVRRRPEYQQKPSQGSPLGVAAFHNVGVAPAASQSPEWKFEGKSGKWHKFKKEESSVSSADIEAQYQINSTGSMNFTANGKPFMLDFSAMKQINLTTKQKRAVRRF